MLRYAKSNSNMMLSYGAMLCIVMACHNASETSLFHPDGYCTEDGNGSTTFLQYPFEPNCYPYIQCVEKQSTVYFSVCPIGGDYCFDVTSGTCSRPKADNGRPLQI